MGAITASTIRRESMGSLTAHFVTFTSVTSASPGDTWTSGLPNIVGAVASFAGGGTGLSAPSCSYVSSTGVVTLVSPDTSAASLIVYSQT